MRSFRGGIPAERAPRFVWVGPHRPLTGINADLWIDAKPGTEVLVAQALAGRVPLETAAREAGVAGGAPPAAPWRGARARRWSARAARCARRSMR
jgi:hypothetical protein